MKVFKCKICEHSFELSMYCRYTAREDTNTGISTAITHTEPKQFDAIDCPQCGCQNILQERLRTVKDE